MWREQKGLNIHKKKSLSLQKAKCDMQENIKICKTFIAPLHCQSETEALFLKFKRSHNLSYAWNFFSHCIVQSFYSKRKRRKQSRRKWFMVVSQLHQQRGMVLADGVPLQDICSIRLHFRVTLWHLMQWFDDIRLLVIKVISSHVELFLLIDDYAE